MFKALHLSNTSVSKDFIILAETTIEGIPKSFAKAKAGESVRVNTAKAILIGRLCSLQ